MKLTSDSEEAFHKHTADLWCLLCVWMISCNDPMSLAVRKTVLEIYGYVTTTTECLRYLATLKSVHRIVFSVLLLFSDKNNTGK